MIYKFEHSIFHTLANLPFYQMNLIQKSFLVKLTAQIEPKLVSVLVR